MSDIAIDWVLLEKKGWLYKWFDKNLGIFKQFPGEIQISYSIKINDDGQLLMSCDLQQRSSDPVSFFIGEFSNNSDLNDVLFEDIKSRENQFNEKPKRFRPKSVGSIWENPN